MADSLPIQIQMGALPAHVKWTPQNLADAMVQRMRLVTAQTFSLFVSGSTEPSSNVGPWFKNGTELFVWSDSAGGYVPITIPIESLGYVIGPDAPDQNLTYFWIETAVGGSPLALKIYFSGAWTDVYATKFAGYSTTTAMNAAIAAAVAAGNATTLAAANAYTDAAIAGIPSNNLHPGISTASGQTELANGAAHAIAGFSYVAGATGYYLVSVVSQFDNSGGDPADMSILVQPTVNGAPVGQGDGDAGANPAGSRWFPSFSELIAANSGETIAAQFAATSGMGSVQLTNAKMSVFYVPGP